MTKTIEVDLSWYEYTDISQSFLIFPGILLAFLIFNFISYIDIFKSISRFIIGVVISIGVVIGLISLFLISPKVIRNEKGISQASSLNGSVVYKTISTSKPSYDRFVYYYVFLRTSENQYVKVQISEEDYESGVFEPGEEIPDISDYLSNVDMAIAIKNYQIR